MSFNMKAIGTISKPAATPPAIIAASRAASSLTKLPSLSFILRKPRYIPPDMRRNASSPGATNAPAAAPAVAPANVPTPGTADPYRPPAMVPCIPRSNIFQPIPIKVGICREEKRTISSNKFSVCASKFGPSCFSNSAIRSRNAGLVSAPVIRSSVYILAIWLVTVCCRCPPSKNAPMRSIEPRGITNSSFVSASIIVSVGSSKKSDLSKVKDCVVGAFGGTSAGTPKSSAVNVKSSAISQSYLRFRWGW